MSNEMIPAGGAPNGAMVPANPFDKANASGAMVAPSADILGGGGGFSETWAINKDRHVFVNKKTQEERTELFVAVAEAHPSRALFPKQGPQKGERVCWSDDAQSSYQGIACGSCPRVSEVDVFNKYYEQPQHQGQARPQFIGDCSLRYTILWHKEFVVAPEGLIMREHEDRVLFNAPKTSIYVMFGRNSYLSKLQQMGVDITQVVTKIKLSQRENKELKSMYDFADFEFVDTLANVMTKVVRTVKVTPQSSAAATPGQAPSASFPGHGLPQMAGQPLAPAAGFPPATPPASGFPTATHTPGAFPGAAAPAAPGFPGTATPAQPSGFPAATASAPAATAPTVAPGFPGAVAPVQQAPAAAPATGPTFQDMAKSKLVSDFNALDNSVKAVVLNVLGVQKIEDIPNDRVIQASQAVASAKSFNPGGAPAPVGAGAGGANPF